MHLTKMSKLPVLKKKKNKKIYFYLNFKLYQMVKSYLQLQWNGLKNKYVWEMM